MAQENKINIAELLKDCQIGMELDCTMYDNLYFNSVNADYYATINCYTLIDGIKTSINFTKYGTFNNHIGAKCVIFPKGKTTWEGFQRPFKGGDIVISDMGDIHLLRTEDSSYCAYRKGKRILPEFDSTLTTNVTIVRLATEEEKQELFDAIKINGYQWNADTKTLEKLVIPKFKVDDKIKLKGGDEFGIITQVADCFYTIKCKNNTHCWPIKKQDDWELINEPKFKVGDRVMKKDGISVPILITGVGDTYYWSTTENSTGVLLIAEQDDWELVPNKFDITTLIPFESKVLVRSLYSQVWSPAIYGFKHFSMYMVVSGLSYCQCIPYEGNEHLLGTTDNCDEYYKTW